MQEQYPLPKREPSPPSMLTPEAGLHRDGEQARLVELVRRRQLQQRQQDGEDTLEWLEESAAALWERILVYSGLVTEPRPRSPRSATLAPANPQREISRPSSNRTKSNRDQTDKELAPLASTLTDHPTTQFAKGPPFPSTLAPSKRRRIIRFVFSLLLRMMYTFRWCTDVCVTRLAHLKPLPNNAALSAYSTSPVYSLHVTADDILRSLIILWAFFYCIFLGRMCAGPLAIMTCLFVGSVSRRVVGRVQLFGNQQQTMQKQQSANQALTGKEIAISPTQPPKSVTSNELSRTRALQNLTKEFPNATHAECNRFFTCVKYNEEATSKRIAEYLKWRSSCGLTCVAEVGGAAVQTDRHNRAFDQTFVERDGNDWDKAAKVAISMTTKNHATQIVDALPEIIKLPQIICSYEEAPEGYIDADSNPNKNNQSSLVAPRCMDGTRIFHLLIARVDLSLATAPTYSLAVALYLDRRLSRSSTELITLLSDLRGGRGWSNPTPWSLLPLVQSIAALLGSHYPERLKRLILVPMPAAATWVWSAAQKCLDPDTARKVVIVRKGEGINMPAELLEFVDERSLSVLEKRRMSFFVGSS